SISIGAWGVFTVRELSGIIKSLKIRTFPSTRMKNLQILAAFLIAISVPIAADGTGSGKESRKSKVSKATRSSTSRVNRTSRPPVPTEPPASRENLRAFLEGRSNQLRGYDKVGGKLIP